jgi:hypothetical protein
MRRAFAMGAALLALAACTTSRVKPEADITVAGSVQRAGGAPVANSRVALTREGDAGDVILTLATLGFACLGGDQAPAICKSAKLTDTGSSGRFTYRMKGKDTQSTLGYSAVLAITAGLDPKNDEATGASTTYRFHVQTERLDLPIRLWEPRYDVQTGTFGGRVIFDAMSPRFIPSALQPGAFDYTVEFARGQETVWRIDDTHPGATFDPRVIEDSTGTVRVISAANNIDSTDVLGDEVAIALRSAARVYESPLDPPFSRGKPCAVQDEKGRRYAQSPCALTDGTFEEPFRPQACEGTPCTEPQHAAAAVDLERNVSATLVVVRGCEFTCSIESSTDGKTWRSVGVTREDLAAFPIRGKTLRYVRATGSSAAERLTEISVWTGKPALPVGSILVAPERFPTARQTTAAGPGARGGSGRAGDDRGGISPWTLVATGILGLAAGALVVTVIKRRKPAA